MGLGHNEIQSQNGRKITKIVHLRRKNHMTSDVYMENPEWEKTMGAESLEQDHQVREDTIRLEAMT